MAISAGIQDIHLQEIIRRLLLVGDPQRIILFGSQSRGEANRESDYDLLVVEPSTKPRYLRAAKYRRALKDIGHPKDIVVWTPEEIAEWQNVPDAFISTAIREGTTLYERPI